MNNDNYNSTEPTIPTVSAKQFLDTWEKTAEQECGNDSSLRHHAHAFADFMEQAIFSNANDLGINVENNDSIVLPKATAGEDITDPTQLFLSAVTLAPVNMGMLFSQANRMEAAQQVHVLRDIEGAPDDVLKAQLDAYDIRQSANTKMQEIFSKTIDELGMEARTTVDPAAMAANKAADRSPVRN